MTPEPHQSPREALAAFVEELHRGYEVWYARSVRRSSISYYTLQLTALLCGFAAAIVAAVAEPDNYAGFTKRALVVLPLFGSLAGMILHFFRVYDRWRFREAGRIAFQDLAIEARRMLAAATTDSECSKLHAQLRARATAIETDQSTRFFGLSRADAVAQFAQQAPS